MTNVSEKVFISTIYDRLLVDDDTEESVTGSDLHLAAILALYDVVLRYALRMARPWYVTAEVLVMVDVPDRSRNPWRSMPDVYVVLDTEHRPRASLDTRAGESFPHFICEVASESTWKEDVGEKQRLYGDLGVREYIVFDPTGGFLGTRVRAWHRRPDGAWAPWTPDAEGFLDSAVLGLRLRAEETLLRVYDSRGRLDTAQELEQITVYQADQLGEQAARLEEQAEQLEELEEERARRQRLEEENARLRAKLSPEG